MASRQMLDLNKMDKSTPEKAMHKNRLQEFTQKNGLALPYYKMVNEGSSHAPKFRSFVLVNGKEFQSKLTYPHRKEAEQDVANLAIKSITEDIKNEEYATLPELKKKKRMVVHGGEGQSSQALEPTPSQMDLLLARMQQTQAQLAEIRAVQNILYQQQIAHLRDIVVSVTNGFQRHEDFINERLTNTEATMDVDFIELRTHLSRLEGFYHPRP